MFIIGKNKVPWLPDFYFIPNYIKYAINIDGDIVNVTNGKFKVWTVQQGQKEKNIKGGYRVTGGVNDKGKYGGISRHRALALIFIPCPGNPKDYVVNHKNGIPGDDWLDNLEWMSRAENNQHAIDNGLCPNSTTPVLCKDLNTDKITRYISVAECSRDIGIIDATIRNRLNRKSGRRPIDELAFKYDDESEWLEYSNEISIPPKAISVCARNIFSGEIIIADSICNLSKATGISPAGIRKSLGRIIATNGFNVAEFTTGLTWPNHTDRHLEIYTKYTISPPSGVVVNNIDTDEEIFFTGSVEAAKYFNISPSQLRTRIRNKKTL